MTHSWLIPTLVSVILWGLVLVPRSKKPVRGHRLGDILANGLMDGLEGIGLVLLAIVGTLASWLVWALCRLFLG